MPPVHATSAHDVYRTTLDFNQRRLGLDEPSSDEGSMAGLNGRRKEAELHRDGKLSTCYFFKREVHRQEYLAAETFVAERKILKPAKKTVNSDYGGTSSPEEVVACMHVGVQTGKLRKKFQVSHEN